MILYTDEARESWKKTAWELYAKIGNIKGNELNYTDVKCLETLIELFVKYVDKETKVKPSIKTTAAIKLADLVALTNDLTEIALCEVNDDGEVDDLYFGYAEDIKQKYMNRKVIDFYAYREDSLRICLDK